MPYNVIEIEEGEGDMQNKIIINNRIFSSEWEEYARFWGCPVEQLLIERIFYSREIYQTNYDYKIQLHFNLTYLQSLFSNGQNETFEAVITMMNDAIGCNQQVIIEEYSENSFPIQTNTLETENELTQWKNTIINKQINNINEKEIKEETEIVIKNINGADVIIKISEDFHEKLENLSEQKKLPINKILEEYICCYRDIYQTNHNGEIILHFNLVYLSDLKTLKQKESINAIKKMMDQAINLEYKVVIEKHYTNSPPIYVNLFSQKNKVELDTWFNNIFK